MIQKKEINNQDNSINKNIINEKKEENNIPKLESQIKTNQMKTKEINQEKPYFDEKGNILEDKIIDNDEFILKDKRVIELMKKQEEMIRNKKNKNYLEKENKDLEETLKNSNNELVNLQIELAKYKKEGILDEDEKIMSVLFSCEELGFEYSVVCRNTDLLVNIVEGILKKEKDGLNYYSSIVYSTVNSEILDGYKSMEKNKIHDGDIIYINCINN